MASSRKTSPETDTERESSERRRRSRLGGKTPGWVLPDNGDTSDPWEVRVNDISRHGVGFESSERLKDGDVVRLRIGRGPIELARRVRVVQCRPGEDGTFKVGGEFV